MGALEARLNRGLVAALKGDLDVAQATLDQVARVPGETTPISGLTPEAEARFYELVGRVAALATHNGIAAAAPTFSNPSEDHFYGEGLEVHRSEGTHQVTLDDGTELFTTLQTYQATVEPEAHPSPEEEAELGWPVPADRDWAECRVEEIRLVRTTVRYDKDDDKD